jgi:hypothetical protein
MCWFRTGERKLPPPTLRLCVCGGGGNVVVCALGVRWGRGGRVMSPFTHQSQAAGRSCSFKPTPCDDGDQLCGVDFDHVSFISITPINQEALLPTKTLWPMQQCSKAAAARPHLLGVCTPTRLSLVAKLLGPAVDSMMSKPSDVLL